MTTPAEPADQDAQGPSEETDAVQHPIPTLHCEICKGVLEPHDGAVTHMLLRLVSKPNPHQGWWRDHPAGPRFICDWCYATDVHQLFAYQAPDYVPGDKATPRDEPPVRENEDQTR